MNLNKIKLNIKHLSLVLIIISFSTQLLYCQDNPKDESENGEAENVNTMVHSLSDSLVIAGNIFTDSLLLAVKNKMLENVHNYSLSADSIILDLKDSLSFSRKDSLGYIKLLLLKNLSLNSESITGNLANIHKNYSEKIIKVKSISFDDIVDASDTLGEINEEFRDTILSAADDFNDSFKDSVENAVDSLNNYSQSLLDNQNDENDRKDSLWDYFYSYGFFCKTGYTSDIQYHGYKGINTQRAYFPGVFYNNSNGLGLLINAYNISGVTVPWDEIEIGASYTHTFGENFTAALSYTNYSFNDTSEIAKQGLKGIVELNLSYEFPFFTTGSSFEVGFGSQNDYAMIISFSRKLMFKKKESYQIWLEPEFSGIYGTESLINSRIVTRKNGKKKPTAVVKTTTNKVFSVLDYMLNLPLNIETGRFIITPEYDFSIPLNQPPFTNSEAFGFFTINVTAKIF